MPEFNEALNIAVLMKEVFFSCIFKQFGGILSCPADFNVFIVESNL